MLVTPEAASYSSTSACRWNWTKRPPGSYLVGTAAYMSPEQGIAGPLSPSSDWYSVGVMLYEALTGRLPFQGQSLQVLLSKRETDPPAPVGLWVGVPDDLNALCMAVLQRDPAARPSEDEILRRLGDMAADSPAKDVVRRVPFVGRGVETRVMSEALAAVRRGRTELVCVRGKSGVGKTALVQQFLATARQSHQAVILAGRCYERESVPFKALDSLVDALSHYLMGLARLEVDALLPRDVVALSQAFPVLERVEAVAQALTRTVATPDRRELRDRAFRALRELLSAPRRPQHLDPAHRRSAMGGSG